MDAKEISKLVRDYFNEIHGQFTVICFRVEAFEAAPNGGWKMECSFLPSMNSTETERINYKIMISNAGEIKNVTSVSKGHSPRPTASRRAT